MVKRQVKFKPENLDRLGNTGVTKYTLDDALEMLLNQEDDINSILMFDEEPHTEKLKALKKKWGKTF
jgi:hypothetical protein